MHDKSFETVLAEGRALAEQHAQPPTGWALPMLIRLDAHRPGMLADTHVALSRRRQVIFACLAQQAMDRPEPYGRLLGQDHCGWHGADWLGLLGEALVTVDSRKLLAVAFGSLPEGFAPVLGRLGADPLPQAVYARLHAIYADPKRRRLQQLLSDLPRITERRLDALELLPECSMHPAILRIVTSLDDARAVAAAVEIALGQSEATVASIRKSVTDLTAESTLTKWVHGLLSRLDRPGDQPDVSALPEAVMLDSGEALREAGRRYENCLGRPAHVLEVACGRSAFLTFTEDLTTMIATLRRVGQGWCVTSLLAAHNTLPHESIRQAAMARLAAAGFPVLGASRAAPTTLCGASATDGGRMRAGCSDAARRGGSPLLALRAPRHPPRPHHRRRGRARHPDVLSPGLAGPRRRRGARRLAVEAIRDGECWDTLLDLDVAPEPVQGDVACMLCRDDRVWPSAEAL